MIFVLSPTSRVRPRGSGFKFFNELLDEGLIGGAVMAEDTDVLLTATGCMPGLRVVAGNQLKNLKPDPLSLPDPLWLPRICREINRGTRPRYPGR